MGILDAPPRLPRLDASIWAMGDSITANGYTAPAGVASHKFNGGQSYLLYACLLSQGRLRFGGIAATGGFRTDQIIATHLPTVLAARPAYCVIQGGTNDIGTLTIAQTLANLQTIYDALLGAGITPIATTMLPKQTLLNASRAPLDRMSMWITRYATAKNFPVVDITTPFINPVDANWIGYAVPGTYNADNTHPNGAGAKAIGQAIWTAIQGYLPPRSPFFPTHNVEGASTFYPTFANALHLNDAGTDGIPDGYNATPGATVSYTVSAMSAGEGIGNWFNIGHVSAGANPQPYTTNSALTAGNRMLFVCKLKTAGIASSASKWHLRLTDSNTVDILALRDMDQDITLGGLWIEFVAPAGTSGNLRFSPYVIGAGTSISVGQVGVYDLTAQGLV